MLDLNKYQPCIILTCKNLAVEHFTTVLHQLQQQNRSVHIAYIFTHVLWNTTSCVVIYNNAVALFSKVDAVICLQLV